MWHWLPVPEPYRVVVPGEGIDTVLHDGYEHMARDIDAACPGTYDKVLEFIRLCRRVYDSMDVISVTPMSKLRMLREHPDFVRVAGYSASEVIRTFDLPQKAVELVTDAMANALNRKLEELNVAPQRLAWSDGEIEIYA